MERLAGKVILLWGWKRALLAFVAGALAVLAQAPFDLFAVCFISFPILVWLLDGATAEPSTGVLKRLAPAFATGWWFGFGYFVAGLWWIGNALLVDAESFAWALPLAVLALPAMLAIFYGCAAALARCLWSDDIGRIFALAFAFGTAEWLRTVLFTGFPWNAIGYAAMPAPFLMQSSSVVGVLGMNVLAVFVFSLPALFAARRHLRVGLFLGVLFVALHASFGLYKLSDRAPEDGAELVVRIVQPSIEQDRKWDASARDRIFATYLALARTPVAEGQDAPELILWPETALPFLLTERPDALAAIGDMLQDGQILLAGAVRAEGPPGGANTRFYNSIVAINDRGELIGALDKTHLVPFGEYVPFEALLSRLGVEKVVELPGGFSAGAEQRPITLPGGLRVFGLICYEIIFPGGPALAANAVDLIVNVTNDAWFGDTPGPYQHFRQAQVRAAETGLPLIRAANNGISGVVDSAGRVVEALALDSVAALDVAVPLRPADVPTAAMRNVAFYTILLVFGLVAASLSFAGRRRLN